MSRTRLRAIASPRLRLVELFLLLVAAGITVTAGAQIPLRDTRHLDLADLAMPLTLIGAFFLVHLSLTYTGSRSDQVVLPLLLTLMGLGLALNLRLAPNMAGRQFRWLILGTLVFATVYHVPLDLKRLLRRYRYTWAIVGIGLVGTTLVAGKSLAEGGPRLWLGLGSHVFQPSEVLKLLLVVFLAGYLSDKRELLSEAATRIGRVRLPPLPYLAPLGIMLGVSLALLAVQRDLGAALLLFAISLAMLYLASSRLDYVLAGLTAFAAGAYLLHNRIAIVANRVAIWRDPWQDAQGDGFQLVQSLMALSGGGLMGTGLGFGSPVDIPAVHTDFVYAAVVEELGLAGAAAVLCVYAVLTLRGFRIAVRAASAFERLLVAGLTFALAVQTLIIVGGVVKLIPLTGITLPFLSYGGTSMVVSAASVALIMRVDGSHS